MHKKIKKLIEEAYEKKLPEEKIEEMADKISAVIHGIDEEEQRSLVEDLDFIIYGPHFTKEKAMYAVSQMVNEDGTTGQHWTCEETRSVAESKGVIFANERFNEYDWYYVLNMLYSDYYNILGNNTDNYAKMALAWLRDKDAPEGKAKKYCYAMK